MARTKIVEGGEQQDGQEPAATTPQAVPEGSQPTASQERQQGAPPLPQLVPQAPTVASAVAEKLVPVDVPKPKRYRVMQDRPISHNGFRTTLRAGKEIDERQYNIAQLRGQGIVLQEIKEGE